MGTKRIAARALGSLLALPLTGTSHLQDSVADAVKHAKDKDPVIRLAAVDGLAKETDPRAEKALHAALKDSDWEVAEHAALGLGEHGSHASIEPLTQLALDAPVLRIRRAAARSLGRISAKEAAGQLERKLTGPDALPAAEALAVLLAGAPGALGLDLKPIEKIALKGKNLALQAEAARALVAGSGEHRAQILEKVLEVKSVVVRCAALDACAGDSSETLDPVLVKLLSSGDLSDLVERRALAALRASLDARAEGREAAAKSLGVAGLLVESKVGVVSARGARLIGMLAERPEAAPSGSSTPSPKTPRFDPAALLAALRPALAHSDAAARAAAVHALARVGGAEAAKLAEGIGEGDSSARVRYQAVRAVEALRGMEEDAVLFLAKRLASDADVDVRIQAAVKLGKKGSSPAVEPLAAALADPAWEVAACAAVSLGKTQSAAAAAPLAKLAREGADWKLRGAAVAGLSNLYQKAAVDGMIPALADKDAFVSRVAHASLVAITRENLPPKVETWKEWWEANKSRVLLVDPETQAEMRRRFSDAQTAPAQVYKDLEIVVLESRGDHIEKLLGKQGVVHRLTMAGKIAESGLQPDALFVANCTGEIEAPDVERLRWFVMTGGRLFGSCWALTETIAKAVPGVLAKFETRDEVLDNVPAEDASAFYGGSPYTEGVVATETKPIFALEGAHLLEIVDPERAEVLLDSPPCADAWGAGDLAAWFEAGHGVVLDSVNHFEAQGLEMAMGLKTREDRQAYAVDHMGLSYAELRATAGEKYWDNSLRASEQVLDLSVFRLVTNFVRLWRREKGK